MNDIAMPSRKDRNKRDTIILYWWSLAWVVTTAIGAMGPESLWPDNLLLMWLAIILNAATGIGMIISSARQLKSMDELQQRITVNAMGITLGVGLVSGITYSLLEASNLVFVEAEISFLMLVMGLTYSAAILAGHRYYR